MPFTFLEDNFGNSRMGTIIIALQENAPGDLAEVAAADFRPAFLEHGAALALTLASAWLLLRTLPGFAPLLLLVSLAGIAVSRPAAHAYRLVFPDPARSILTVDGDFHPPVIEARPVEKPNLVLIVLESLERSYRDIPATQDAFSAMAAFEDANFSVRAMGQIDGTHYSAAGFIASHCGIPLFSRGLLNTHRIRSEEDRQRMGLDRFLPGVTCLGDILVDDGYRGSYVNGSDVDIFSMGQFVRDHGYATAIGLKTDTEAAAEPGQNSWGVPDSVLFREAKAEMRRLAAGGTPFFISVFTAATHGPYGFPEEDCTYSPPIAPVDAESKMPAAIKCSIDQVFDFVAEIERLGLADRTVVAVLSDHLAMPNTLRKELGQLGAARNNLFVIAGSAEAPAEPISARPSTQLDVFPTLLESMGYRLAEGGANLGRSLWSNRETLAERHGPELLERALKANRDIAERVWEAPE